MFLHVLVTAALSGNGSTETALTAAPGDIALLPCYTASAAVAPTLTTWMKNGREIIRGGGGGGGPSPSPSPDLQRLTVLHDGSLNIAGVIPEDEGSYLCNSTLPDNNTFWARVLLQVTSKFHFQYLTGSVTYRWWSEYSAGESPPLKLFSECV